MHRTTITMVAVTLALTGCSAGAKATTSTTTAPATTTPAAPSVTTVTPPPTTTTAPARLTMAQAKDRYLSIAETWGGPLDTANNYADDGQYLKACAKGADAVGKATKAFDAVAWPTEVQVLIDQRSRLHKEEVTALRHCAKASNDVKASSGWFAADDTKAAALTASIRILLGLPQVSN